MSKDYTKVPEKKWRKMDPPMLPPRNVKIQLELMAESNMILDVCGLRHFLVDGCLIHVVRDGELKPYNQDIDYACYAEEIKPRIKKLKQSFLQAGYDVRAYKNNTRLDTWKKGEMVSIDGYEDRGDKFRWMKNKKIPKRYFENPESVSFLGHTYVTPMINKYLKWKYTNWKKPYKGDTKNKCYLNNKRLKG